VASGSAKQPQDSGLKDGLPMLAATTPLAKLIEDYEADLRGRGLDDRHVHDTITRLKRMVAETGWRSLSDIRPDAFVRWRASLKCSAKTIKEYQTSAAAFLNWLVRVDRLAANPLAKTDKCRWTE
jgi:hypothetical protein